MLEKTLTRDTQNVRNITDSVAFVKGTAIPLISSNSAERKSEISSNAISSNVSEKDIRLQSIPVNESTSFNSLSQVRNGYDRLSSLALDMKENHALLSRGMKCAQSRVSNSYHNGLQKILGVVGLEYIVPDLRETVHLQLSNVRQYGACVDAIIVQTNRELKSTHDYVNALAKDVLKYSAIKEKLAPNVLQEHPSMSLSELCMATDDVKKLNSFMETHDKRIHSILQRGDSIVADRAIQRKSEYLRHAYSVELLLVGSLTTAKQIAVDAGCYASMLDRLASAYFNMGCNSSQLRNILGGLNVMQKFTDGMQESVVEGMQRLDKALVNTRTNIGSNLESAVYKMR